MLVSVTLHSRKKEPREKWFWLQNLPLLKVVEKLGMSCYWLINLLEKFIREGASSFDLDGKLNEARVPCINTTFTTTTENRGRK